MIPGSGRSPGNGRNGHPLQSSGLKTPMDREAWGATVLWVSKGSDMTTHTHQAEFPTPARAQRLKKNHQTLTVFVLKSQMLFSFAPCFVRKGLTWNIFSSCKCLSSTLSFPWAVQSAGCVAGRNQRHLPSELWGGRGWVCKCPGHLHCRIPYSGNAHASVLPETRPPQSRPQACRKATDALKGEGMLLCISAHPNTRVNEQVGKKGRLCAVGGGWTGALGPHLPSEEPPALSDPGRASPVPSTLEALVHTVRFLARQPSESKTPTLSPYNRDADARELAGPRSNHAALSRWGTLLSPQPPTAKPTLGHFFHAPGRHTEEV